MLVSFGPARVHVDRHREERVDERDRVRAGLFGGSRERRDVGDVRRQLRDHRQRRHLAHRADDIVRAGQAAAEGDPALLDVRAGDVELDRGHALVVRQDPRDLAVLVDRRAADVHEHDRAAVAQLRQLLAHEPVHADALQADRVQHAGRRLDDPRRRVAFALGEEQALDRDAAERRQIDDVGCTRRRSRSSRSRRSADWQRQRADGNGKIHVSARARPRRCASRRTPGRRCTIARSAAVPPAVARRARRSCSSRRGRSP